MRKPPQNRADITRLGKFAALLCLVSLFPFAADAQGRLGQSTGMSLPRYASLKADLVNMRRGPGTDYAIKWQLTRANLPVQIVSEYGAWRKVVLHDAETGWIHSVMLGGERFATPIGKGAALRPEPSLKARQIALAKPSVALSLKQCSLNWCLVEAGSTSGWARKQDLWGVGPEDQFE
ncbi:MAG: SH3 domain-containing protein [Neomegalonema sp.]|nr:SH3 domain-containing protein [Neomegalonema sp.]